MIFRTGAGDSLINVGVVRIMIAQNAPWILPQLGYFGFF
jgi:hypothetical protein